MPLFKGLTWTKFLNGIASDGGNILVLVFLVVLFVGLGMFGYGDAFHQVELITAALLGIFKGSQNKKDNTDED